MNKGVYYFLFLVVVMGSLMIYFKIEREAKMKNPNLSDLATEPDVFMTTADRSYHDNKKSSAIKYLDQAIETMRLLEKEGDSVSRSAIEVAIHDLQIVEEHIKSDDIDDDFMYEAFADAMNSLAFASLRISEQFLVAGKTDEAKVTISHAMDHLQNSITFARGEQKEDEIRIAAHLQRIIENHLEEDWSEIELVMAEIDSVIQAHVIQ